MDRAIQLTNKNVRRNNIVKPLIKFWTGSLTFLIFTLLQSCYEIFDESCYTANGET